MKRTIHSPLDQERVGREIKSMDKSVDRLVSPAETLYELSRKGMISGLTDDEIRIVEEENDDR